MKKTTLLKATYVVLLLLSISSFSQNFTPFTPRFDADVKGDMLMIGNNILNRNNGTNFPNDPYNGTSMNSSYTMEYIDIDADASTFCSSSADLDIPPTSCNRVVYAGLYWAATLQSGSRTNINTVKLKLPTGGYNDITGQIIYDADTTPIGNDNMKPYTCYANVTNLITALTNPEGTYTVANVLSSQGTQGGTGLSAGWSLFIVYENPTLTTKSIVSFDGFSAVGGATTLALPITGFRTIPFGPVRAKFAISALEGDVAITGDYLQINGNTITTAQRPSNNFFNSTIGTATGPFTTRNPNGSNTLGFDAGIFNINNPGNAVLANNATSATITLGSTQDVYFYYFNAFAVDIVEPKIALNTTVKNNLGMDVSGGTVNLGDEINYIISFQNAGNDNATSLTISNFIPTNLVFDPASLSLPGALPAGVTFDYIPAAREIIFTIPNNLVEVGDPRFDITIKANAFASCGDYISACSSFIQNQAFASYSGTFNTVMHIDEPSNPSNGLCGAATSVPTEFSVSLSSCVFTKNEIVCDNTITLSAADGYPTYVWSGPGTITPVVGTNSQSVTVSEAGIYTVNDQTGTASCVSITETFNVASCYPSNAVTQNGNRLTAVENNATYQWIDCDNGNQPILNETNQFFEPAISGNYAVIVTNAGNYQVTSACIPFTFLGTAEFEKLGLKLYPNPIADKFYITGDIEIKQLIIYNLLGQQILKFNGNTKEYSIYQLQTGTYLVKVEKEKGIVSSRIIKN